MSWPRSIVVLCLPGLLALSTAAPGEAAPVTWADPAGLCNGQAPCFSTLAAAVANAGPPPATVFVFPGTYAESVDLGQMGSAIGGGPGELAVVSVDATGLPAPGAVVDAGAPGGPGSGRAIEAVLFPARLSLDGLVLRSPDTDGLLIAFGSADIALRRITSSGNPGGNGVLAFSDSVTPIEIVAEDLRADGNGEDGLRLGATRVVARDLIANNNTERGIGLGGAEVSGQRLMAEGNGGIGVEVSLGLGAATFDLADISVRGNTTGLVVFPDSSATSATGLLSTVAAAGHANLGILVFCDQLVAAGLDATQNGDGMILSVQDRLEASELGAVGNAGVGIGAVASEVRLSTAVAADNLTGIAVGGDFVVLADSTASGNGPAGAELFDGAGFVVFANRLEGSGNSASGNEIGWIFDEADPFARVLSRLDEVPSRLTTGFAARGGPLPPQRLTLSRTTTEGSLTASMQVRLRDQGLLSVACSDFLGNSPPGLDLATDHTVDAHFNFWGDPSGPSHPSNPGGTGDAIRDGANGGAGTVLFGGFLGAPAADEDCPRVAVVEVPALGPLGLGLLALALAITAVAGGRRLGRRAARPLLGHPGLGPFRPAA